MEAEAEAIDLDQGWRGSPSPGRAALPEISILAILRRLQEKHEAVRVIQFDRNYGQHAAIFAGTDHARGEIVVTLDADLQDLPEDIPRLLDKISQGHDWWGGGDRTGRITCYAGPALGGELVFLAHRRRPDATGERWWIPCAAARRSRASSRPWPTPSRDRPRRSRSGRSLARAAARATDSSA